MSTQGRSGEPEQVSCPLKAWKTNIDERSGRRLHRGVPSSVLQYPAFLVQAALQAVTHWSRLQWSQYKLGHASCVVVHTVQGSLPVPYVREESALPRTFLDYVILYGFSWILALFVPKVLHVHLYERCPPSGKSHAFRGVYEGVPFLVRTLRTPRARALADEWSRLPRGPSVSQLPIPRYYGLFQIGEHNAMVLTYDNRVTVDRVDEGTTIEFQ